MQELSFELKDAWQKLQCNNLQRGGLAVGSHKGTYYYYADGG
jgi:hypothetical protein